MSHYPHCPLPDEHCLMNCLDVSSMSQIGIWQEQCSFSVENRTINNRTINKDLTPLNPKAVISELGGEDWIPWLVCQYLMCKAHIHSLFCVAAYFTPRGCSMYKIDPSFLCCVNFQYLI